MTHSDIASAPLGTQGPDPSADAVTRSFDIPAVLGRIERYLDELPLRDGHAERFGPLTLYVRDTPGPPRHGRPSAGAEVTAADIAAVRARQRELGVAESFEWVHEAAPAMRAAAGAAGLRVTDRPMLALPPDAPMPDELVDRLPEGVTVRTVEPGDPCLASALAVPQLAFAEIGTHVGTAGEQELAERTRSAAAEAVRMAGLIRAGHSTLVAAVRDDVALCSGLFPGTAAGAAEICAVGTLPTARRQGLASAVTAALVVAAQAQGVETLFIGATDDAVAHIYEGVGFRRVGTYVEAEPA